MMFDTDTMRMASAWSAADPPDADENFIDWRGIQFNGEHQIHPSVKGSVTASNGTGPGWENPETGDFFDDQRVLGRDGLQYGPLPREWGKFNGTYYHGQQVMLSYSVGRLGCWRCRRCRSMTIRLSHPYSSHLQSRRPARSRSDATDRTAGGRHWSGAGSRQLDSAQRPATRVIPLTSPVRFGRALADQRKPAEAQPMIFDGQTFLEVSDTSAFDMTGQDFTITARVKTRGNGTIFAIARPDSPWTPDGQTFFIRDGRLGFDIGWVGAVSSQKKINDGQWHNVAATCGRRRTSSSIVRRSETRWQGNSGSEGERCRAVSCESALRPPTFRGRIHFFEGELDEVRFYQRHLTDELKVAEIERCSQWMTWLTGSYGRRMLLSLTIVMKQP